MKFDNEKLFDVAKTFSVSTKMAESAARDVVRGMNKDNDTNKWLYDILKDEYKDK